MFRFPAARLAVLMAVGVAPIVAQGAPPAFDVRLDSIAQAPRSAMIERDVRTLAGFGTRNTYSDTLSTSRGIGAARRFVFAEFQRISAACGKCLEVRYQQSIVKGTATESRTTPDVNVVNVIAIQRGTTDPGHVVMMSGDIDSRNSNGNDVTKDAPGANDNASGMSGVLEAARTLTRYKFGKTIIYTGLSGEEQGLYGGTSLAKEFVDSAWVVEAVLNNDMIGNVSGINGEMDNRSFRIFSEPVPVTETEADRRARRSYGGEVDGPSRQLARYIERVVREHMPAMQPRMIYRLDRFGRGGHHKPFNDLGMPAVRIMETHENYDRQHQDVRSENGREFGDVVSGVNFDYAAHLTGANAVVLASLAWAPAPPGKVRVQGAVSPSTSVSWTPAPGDSALGYKVYWRETTSPQWQNWRWVPVGTTLITLQNVVIDDFYFGVAAVGRGGHESVIQFPSFVR
ncbi:MAG: M28 family metallopeptidase [Gemmatimonadota bacterium]